MIRKCFVILGLLFSMSIAHAQIDRGTYLFGLSGKYTNDFLGTGTSLSITPRVGYFLANRFALGASVSISHAEVAAIHLKSDAYGIGPFARYYFFKSVKYNLFIQPSFLYSRLKTETIAPGMANSKLSTLANRYAIAMAPVYFINQYIAIEVIAEYQREAQDEPNPDELFEIKLGIQVHL